VTSFARLLRVLKPKWNEILFRCPRCNAPITNTEYIGADPQLSARFYRCGNCGEIIKKPIKAKRRRG